MLQLNQNAVPAALSHAFIIFGIATFGVFAGIRLSMVHSIARPLVAFSGGVLVGVALFWVLPDLAIFFGWPGAIAWVSSRRCRSVGDGPLHPPGLPVLRPHA